MEATSRTLEPDHGRRASDAPPVPAGRRPRVLRIATRLNIGGPARQVLFLTDEMRRKGFDTRLIWGAAGRDEGCFDPPAHLPATYVPHLQRNDVAVSTARG